METALSDGLEPSGISGFWLCFYIIIHHGNICFSPSALSSRVTFSPSKVLFWLTSSMSDKNLSRLLAFKLLSQIFNRHRVGLWKTEGWKYKFLIFIIQIFYVRLWIRKIPFLQLFPQVPFYLICFSEKWNNLLHLFCVWCWKDIKVNLFSNLWKYFENTWQSGTLAQQNSYSLFLRLPIWHIKILKSFTTSKFVNIVMFNFEYSYIKQVRLSIVDPNKIFSIWLSYKIIYQWLASSC